MNKWKNIINSDTIKLSFHYNFENVYNFLNSTSHYEMNLIDIEIKTVFV